MAAACASALARPAAPCAPARLASCAPRRAAFTACPAQAARPQREFLIVRAADGEYGGNDRNDRYQPEERFQERVVQVRRVTKVVKGGKQLSFRAVVVVGDEAGSVGVGVGSSKEVVGAVQKAVAQAKRRLVTVPLNENASFPHRIDGIFGAAKVMLRPASEGTGVIAGGAVRVVLELAGVKNAFGKQLGTKNPMNNAKAAVVGLQSMRTVEQVSQLRDVPVETLYG